MSGLLGAQWHGSSEEASVLVEALNANCACLLDPTTGGRTSTCGAHALLLGDQRALDGLLWMRHLRERLLVEEYDVPTADTGAW